MKYIYHIIALTLLVSVISCKKEEEIKPVIINEETLKVLPDRLDFKKETYIITGIAKSEKAQIAIINGNSLHPGDTISDGIILKSVESNYIIIDAKGQEHLLRPRNIQEELLKK